MLTPLYLPTDGGSRFALYHRAEGECLGLAVYLHPLAEEMNKSRRMVGLQARALSAGGVDVLQIDLLGCGDSSGDFGEAAWDHWLQDARRAAHWLKQQRSNQPDLPLWWWGLRSGALLATDVVNRHVGEFGPCNFLFWQPATSGKTALQQFLRLKTAGQIARTATSTQDQAESSAGSRASSMHDLRETLRQGSSIDVAGYTVSPELASGLEAASLKPPTAAGQRLLWLECSPRDTRPLLPASQKAVSLWQQAGYTVAAECVQGPAFWQTTEVEDAPKLIAATTRLLTTGAAHLANKATA